jgi:outer membrane lipoprotein-sorting protein
LKKTVVLVPALLTAAALGLSGCSAQLSTKDSCAQYQSIEKNVSTLGGTPSSSQVSGVASQMGTLAQKSSDDVKKDIAAIAEGLEGYANGDQSALSTSKVSGAVSHLHTVCSAG